MVGRDIGTVVLKEAPLKIYLHAPFEERARRRFRELIERGREADINKVREDMKFRDLTDSQRALAPLRPAEDAHQIQTSGKPADTLVDQILALASTRLGIAPDSNLD